MQAAKVLASLRICTVSPEPPLLAHTSSESRGTFRQKVSSLAPLNGWACAVKICHDWMLEDTNSLDAPQMLYYTVYIQNFCLHYFGISCKLLGLLVSEFQFLHQTNTRLIIYYIRPLLCDIMNVSLQFSQFLKCFGYNINCISAVMHSD